MSGVADHSHPPGSVRGPVSPPRSSLSHVRPAASAGSGALPRGLNLHPTRTTAAHLSTRPSASRALLGTMSFTSAPRPVGYSGHAAALPEGTLRLVAACAALSCSTWSAVCHP